MIPHGISLFLLLDKYRSKPMGKQNRSERGKMIVGLTQVIGSRKPENDVTAPPRWNYDTLVSVERPEARIYKVVYVRSGTETTEYLSTSQMSVAEMQSLLAFVKGERPEIVEPVPELPEEPKPKVSGSVLLTGMEKLERQFRASETPISESIRDTSVVVPEIKYRTVKVTKTYTVTQQETYYVRFTDKTLSEFKDMALGGEEDQLVYNYLLRRQTAKLEPVACKEIDTTDPVFAIVEEE